MSEKFASLLVLAVAIFAALTLASTLLNSLQTGLSFSF